MRIDINILPDFKASAVCWTSKLDVSILFCFEYFRVLCAVTSLDT